MVMMMLMIHLFPCMLISQREMDFDFGGSNTHSMMRLVLQHMLLMQMMQLTLLLLLNWQLTGHQRVVFRLLHAAGKLLHLWLMIRMYGLVCPDRQSMCLV